MDRSEGMLHQTSQVPQRLEHGLWVRLWVCASGDSLPDYMGSS
jgi:hypothetical protein